MSDNVVSITSGLPLSEEEKLNKRAVEEKLDRERRAVVEDFAASAAALNKALDLLVKGRVTGLMILAQDPVTGLFYHDLNLRRLPREAAFAYMGLLQTLIVELQQHAAMAPTINADGNVVDPYRKPKP